MLPVSGGEPRRLTIDNDFNYGRGLDSGGRSDFRFGARWAVRRFESLEDIVAGWCAATRSGNWHEGDGIVLYGLLTGRMQADG